MSMAPNSHLYCQHGAQSLVAHPASPSMPYPVPLPHPQVYELVISAVGGELSTTLFLDDSVRNIAAAHKLGIFSVLVGREGHVAGADACIATFAGLPAVLLQLFVEPLPLRASEDGMEAAVGAGVPIHVPA